MVTAGLPFTDVGSGRSKIRYSTLDATKDVKSPTASGPGTLENRTATHYKGMVPPDGPLKRSRKGGWGIAECAPGGPAPGAPLRCAPATRHYVPTTRP